MEVGRRDWAYCRFEMSCAASLLWPHLPINPQALMEIMTKCANMLLK